MLEYADTRGGGARRALQLAGFHGRADGDGGRPFGGQVGLAEGGDGVRTVYMRLTDVAGNRAVLSDTIEV